MAKQTANQRIIGMRQKLIDLFDTEIEFLENLHVFRPVYKAKRDGEIIIFKSMVYDPTQPYDLERHLISETIALERCAGIEGISHLVEDFGFNGSYYGIAKEFFPGAELYRIGKLKNKILQARLEKTLDEIHRKGVVDVDIKEENIVVSPDGEDIKIIDLGYVRFAEELGAISVGRKMKEDYKKLISLFGK